MKRKQLLTFFAITIVVIIAAALFAKSRAPQTEIVEEKLFPGLVNRINDVARIEIKSSESRSVILQQQDGQWQIQSADNYPAVIDRIKNTVISLSELKILATKTDNPKLYPELGVEDPGTDTTSLLLTLMDKSGATLATLIVGKPRKNTAGQIRPNLYVRKPDEKNALLVEGYLQIKPENNDWYERNIIHIPAARIQEVNIVKATGDQLRISKDSAGSTEFKIAEGNTPAPTVLLNKLATFFEDMRADGVHAVDNFEFPEDATITTFKTFNGLLVTVKSISLDDRAYAHFSFTTTPSATDDEGGKRPASETENISVEEESRLWNGFLSNWVYEIPLFKYETLNIDVGQT